MKPVHRNFNIWRGNSETLKFRLLASAGVPLDLTGSEVTMYIDSAGELTTHTATVVDPVTGEFSIFLSAAVTRALSTSAYVPKYEIERKIGQEQKTILHGNLLIGGGLSND